MTLLASTERAPAAPTTPGRSAEARAAFALGLFALVAVGVYVDFQLSLAFFDYTPLARGWPYHPWLDTFARYDSGWYYAIADTGYFYNGPGQQSAVAFFPAYPLSMRALGVVAGDALVGGVLMTLGCGAGAAVLFYRWCAGVVGERTARLALGLVLLYPFAFYLFGVVYSDALFLLVALGAFSLLERDRPLLAGLVGAIGTASRPVGVALVIGLVLRALERRGVISWKPRRLDWSRLRARDASVLASVGGVVLFSLYLWHRFGEPFAFLKVGDSVGWYRTIDLRTVAKVEFVYRWRDYGLNVVTFWLTVQGLCTVGALAAVPAIVRRFGLGYGAYSLVAVGLAVASSPDFVGMGRYVLVAFPVFALVAERLASASAHQGRRWLPGAVLAVSGTMLVWMASLFARWVFLA